MLSKHPLDITSLDKKFDKEKLAQALRLSIIAELDAINLYLQLAERIEDEKYRRVFLDVAKEEKTHVGEFLALLKNIDSEQVEELKSGLEEVKELTGLEIGDPPTPKINNTEETVIEEQGPFTRQEWESLMTNFRNTLVKYSVFREHLPVTILGRGVEYVLLPSKTGLRAIPICELSVDLRISQRLIEAMRRNGELPARDLFLIKASELAYLENDLVLRGCGEEVKGLLNIGEAITFPITSWEEHGTALKEVAEVLSYFGKLGIIPPYKLFVNPTRYAKLLRITGREGMLELERIRRLVGDVVIVSNLPEDVVLLIASSPQYLDLIVGRDATIDYIGPDKGDHVFRIWETMTLRIKEPKAIVIMKQQQ